MKPNQRRRIYIKGSFQRQFVMQFCGMVLVGCVLFGGILYFYTRRVLESADFLLPALGATTVIVTTLVALAAGARVLVFSHKIAGPLYRLEKAAEAVGQGDLSQRVNLREGDELQAFAQSMDFAVAELRWQLEQVRHEADRVGKIVREMKKGSGVSPKFLEELEQAQREMDRALNRFKV